MIVTNRETPWFNTWLIGAAIVALPLLYGAFNTFFVGHSTLASSNYVPWNIYVVAYAFFVSGIGLCYLGSMGLVFGFKQFYPIAKRSLFLSICIVISGLIAIVMDLGQPLRAALYYPLSPNINSPLWMLGTLYNLYLVMLIWEYYVSVKHDHDEKISKIAGISTFTVALIVHSTLGSVFGMTYAKPHWYGPYYPVYFIISAFIAAVAIYIPVTVASYKIQGKPIDEKMKITLAMLGRLLSYFILTGAFFYAWKIRAAFFAETPETKELMFGSFAVSFWILEIGLGYIVPWIILAQPKLRTPEWMSIAGIIALIGMFAGRYNFIILGQLIPDWEGQVQGINTYVPNLVEISTVIGIFGVIALLYGFGMKYFDLDEEHDSNH